MNDESKSLLDEDLKIYDNVVTLRVRVRCPSESKKDHYLSQKLCDDTGAQSTSLRVRKDLYKLSNATRWRDKARKTLRDRCVPWSALRTDAHSNRKEDALWACSGREIEEVAAELQQYREEFFTEVKKMTDSYEELLDDAKSRLGSAFNPDDFPTKEEFRERWGWEVEVKPLQELSDMAEDFRLKLPKQMAEEQVRLAEEKLKQRMTNGAQNVIDRTMEKIMGDEDCPGLIPRLREYDPDPNDARIGNTYRDKSLYDNIDDHKEWVDGINDFLDMPELQELSDRIEEFCATVRPKDPQVVRDDPKIREQVIGGLMEIVDACRPVSDDRSRSSGGGFGQFA